ncbi:MAG: MFS transporter, partial [Gammaproteobacteria bacterium]|nr:MFS transporter [Gammaproteobacteria bacterium]
DQWTSLTATFWFLPAAYFLLSIAHDGVRVGRKTYIVDLAGGSRRTDYVAVSNTAIGIVLLLAGAIGTLSAVVSIGGIILILSVIAAAGALVGTALPELKE